MAARTNDRGFGLALQKLSGLGPKDFRTAFRRISRAWLREVDQGFIRETDPYGESWEHLSPRTIRAKRRKGSKYPTAILRDTELLRFSFQAAVSRTGFSIFTDRAFEDGTTPEIHQFGGVNSDGRTIPARPFLPFEGLPETWRSIAEGYLGDDLDNILR